MKPCARSGDLTSSVPAEGYDGEDLTRILKDIEGSSLVRMDRWSVQVVTDEGQAEGDPVPYEIINNYFSIGVVSFSETPRERRFFFFFLLVYSEIIVVPTGRLHRSPVPHDERKTSSEIQQQVQIPADVPIREENDCDFFPQQQLFITLHLIY